MPPVDDGVSQIEIGDVIGDRAQHQGVDHGLRHSIGHRIHLLRRHGIADLPVEACTSRVSPPGGVEAFYHAVPVHHLEPAADMDRRRHLDLAFFKNGEFRRATTDINIQDALIAVLRCGGGTRSERRQHAFHVVARGGADEIAALFGHSGGDALRVFAAQRLARQDDCPGVYFAGAEARRGIRIVEDFSQFGV